MKRKRKNEDQDFNIESDQFIEREIVIGLITDSEFTKEILKLKNADPVKLLGASTAKRMAKWCLDYYKKYQEAPGIEIESIYLEQTKNDKKENIRDIEDILADLSNDYEKKEDKNTKYLFDRAFEYFQQRNGEQLKEDLEYALEQNDLDEFYKLQASFKPIQVEEDEKTTMTGMEIYNAEIKPIEWLIDSLIPKGLTIFGGQSKLGKSYFTLYLTMHLAQGKYMFGDETYRGNRGSVLYLALEDTTERIQNRIRAIEPNPNEKFIDRFLTIKWSFEKLYKGGLNDLEDWLKKSKRPKLIVIDVIVKVWDMKNSTGAGRYYNQEYQIFSPLSDLAHKYDTSIIAITHTKKTKEVDVFNEILGGAGTQGPADNLMVLSRHPSNLSQRILSVRGKDMEEQHLQFDVTNDGATWECLGEVGEVQKTNERQEIVDHLIETGAMSFKDIVQAAKDREIKVSPNSVQTILRKMVKDETLVQSKTYGKYAVTGAANGMIKISEQRKLVN